MIKKIISTVILSLLLSTTTEAGYDEMKDAYESYHPPSYFDSQLIPPRRLFPPTSDNSIQTDLERIHELRSKWDGLRSKNDENSAFVVIDPGLMASVAIAGTDTNKAISTLKNNVTIELIEALVLLRNPSIDAARNKLGAAIEKISQIEALDAILRQYSAITEGTMNGIGPRKGKSMVAFEFPFPGILSLKSQIIEKDVEMAMLDLEIARREAVTAVRKSFWDLIYIKKSRAITQEILTMLTQLEEVAATRYEAGKTSYQDVIRLHINKETLETTLKTLSERQTNIETMILSQLDLPVDTKIGEIDYTIRFKALPVIDRMYELAAIHRQEIIKIRANIDKMERVVELAETMILPPYTSNLSTFENKTATSVGTFNQRETFPTRISASKGAGLPKKAWYGSSDAYLRQTREKILALKASLKNMENNTTLLVRDAWFELDRSRREESLLANSVVDLSRNSLGVSTHGYESGTVAFADVFESYKTWFKANLALERKRSDIGVFRAELERVIGKSLSRINPNS